MKEHNSNNSNLKLVSMLIDLSRTPVWKILPRVKLILKINKYINSHKSCCELKWKKKVPYY